jgi:hypothetical protein
MSVLNSRRLMLCLPSAGTQVTLVDDDYLNFNGSNGFSVNRMRISKLYYKRNVSDTSQPALKVLNFRIENTGNPGGCDMNISWFYDGVNVPTQNQKFFANIVTHNEVNSVITYDNCSESHWDYINKTPDTSDNMKTITIYVYENGTALCGDITVDNRLYLELEFY